MKNCKWCNKEFELLTSHQLYCSINCQNDAHNAKRRKSVKVSICEMCGKEFIQKRKDNITCSRICGRKLWAKNNPEKSDNCDRGKMRHDRFVRWREGNRDKVRAIKQRYKAKRRLRDINYKLNKLIGNSIRRSIQDKGFKKWSTILGYNIETLKKHLETTLPEGITWNDYLKGGYHIDHIIPISSYQFYSYEDNEFKKCWNYRNLRIIEGQENLEKLSSIQPELIKKYKIEDLLPIGVII